MRGRTYVEIVCEHCRRPTQVRQHKPSQRPRFCSRPCFVSAKRERGVITAAASDPRRI